MKMVKAENGTAKIIGEEKTCAVEIASILGSFKHNLRKRHGEKEAERRYKVILALADATCDELVQKDKSESDSDRLDEILDQLAETISDIVVDAFAKKGDR
jgi:hypothetical protein